MDSVQQSKFLSYVLRHNPGELGLKPDEAGWVDIDKLLRAAVAAGREMTREQLLLIVETSDKKRFAISEDGTRIRANQGHSIDVELGYTAVPPPAVLYHGTAERFVESIKQGGLIKGQRHHVHMSEAVETASAVGKRYGTLRLLRIDAARMHAAGHQFFRSENGVWLTEHVPVEFIDFGA